MARLAALGEAMVELYAGEPLSQARELTKACGGDTLDVLVTARRLGAEATWLTRLGQDLFEDYLRDLWAAEGLDLSGVLPSPEPNGIYFISLLEGGQREFSYWRKGSAASTYSVADLPQNAFKRLDCFHSSGISQAISDSMREAVQHAYHLAREARALTCYDPNYRPRLWSHSAAAEAFREVLPYLDVVTPSAPEEISLLLGARSPEEAIAKLLDEGVKYVAIKLGYRGVMLGWEDQRLSIEAHDFGPVVDTTGAGDAFVGGFLYGLMNHLDPISAATIGVTVASLKCLGRGALDSLPNRDQVQARLDFDLP